MNNNPSIDAAGWQSDLDTFRATEAAIIQNSLEEFVLEFSHQQADAWRGSIPFYGEQMKILTRTFSGIDGERRASVTLSFEILRKTHTNRDSKQHYKKLVSSSWFNCRSV